MKRTVSSSSYPQLSGLHSETKENTTSVAKSNVRSSYDESLENVVAKLMVSADIQENRNDRHIVPGSSVLAGSQKQFSKFKIFDIDHLTKNTKLILLKALSKLDLTAEFLEYLMLAEQPNTYRFDTVYDSLNYFCLKRLLPISNEAADTEISSIFFACVISPAASTDPLS